MGELYIHKLHEYIDKYDNNIFIETGSGNGTGITHALQYTFDKLYSIEYMEQLYNTCRNKFNDKRLQLLNCSSTEGLEYILSECITEKDSVLFWLDAHFPGADFQLGEYDADIPIKLKLPLEEELNIIYNYRKNCKDVFIIDDLQLFEDGNYEIEIENEYLKSLNLNNDFIYDMYSTTHDIHKDYRHQGFLIGVPK